MAEAAEAPAAAPEDTLYHDIVASIQKTYDEEESPRGNNTASLAVHAAMARISSLLLKMLVITR